MSDIFVSHSSKDNPAATQFFDQLHGRGYHTLFFDIDARQGLQAGREWERQLYRKLVAARAVVLLCTRDSMASKWCFAEVAVAKTLGKRVFPVRLDDCEIDSTLQPLQVVDVFSQGDAAWERLWIAMERAGLDPRDDFGWKGDRPPYPGLSPFEREDAAIYFGRQREVYATIEALTSMRERREPSVALILGASGTGKSSLLRAGVLPRLEKEPARWIVAPPFRPGSAPLTALAKALAALLHEAAAESHDWEAIRRQFATRGGAAAVRAIAERVAIGARRDAALLLPVDQCEELLSAVPAASGQDDEHTRFQALLRELGEGSGGRVLVVGTLRSDFLNAWQTAPGLSGVARRSIELDPMRRESFRDVIEGPARRIPETPLEFEPALVDRMIEDTKSDDALPLLAFALSRVYRHCLGRERCTVADYEAVGGIEGAIARAILQIEQEQLLTARQAEKVLSAFTRLVRYDEGSQGSKRLVRRNARLEDVPADVQTLLRRFAERDVRLLVFGAGHLELVHESVFRLWPPLARWLGDEENLNFLRWRERIHQELEDSPKPAPLHGERLARALHWLRRRRAYLTPREVRFIRRSSFKSHVRRAAFTAPLVVILAALAAIAIINSRQTQDNRLLTAQAEAQRLAQASIRARPRLPQRSILLAVEALQSTGAAGLPLPGAEQALRDALAQSGGYALPGAALPLGVTLSPDGLSAFIGSEDGSASIWKLAGGRPSGPPTVLRGPGSWRPAGWAITPDFRWAVAFRGGQVRLWDVIGAPTKPKDTIVKDADFLRISVTPTGKHFVLAGKTISDEKGAVWFWDTTQLAEFPRERQIVRDIVGRIACSPDGHSVAGSTERGVVAVWHVDNLRAPPREFPQLEDGTYSDPPLLAFSHPGKSLVVARNKALLTIPALGAPGEPVKTRRTEIITALAASPHSDTVAEGSADGAVTLHANGLATPLVGKSSGAVTALTFVDEGRQLLVGKEDGSIERRTLSSAAGGLTLAFKPHEGAVSALLESADRARFLSVPAASPADFAVRVWELDSGGAPVIASPLKLPVAGRVSRVAISGDGHCVAAVVATEGGSSTVRTWDLSATSSTSAELPVGSRKRTTVALNDQATLLAVGHGEGTVELWGREAARPIQGTKWTLKGEMRAAKFAIQHLILRGDGRWLAARAGTGPWTLAPVAVDGSSGSATALQADSGVAFSRDGKSIFAAVGGKIVREWNLPIAADARPKVLHAASNVLDGIAVSSDRRWLASVGWNTLDVSEQRQSRGGGRHRLQVERAQFSGVAITGDTRRLLAGGEGLYLWNLGANAPDPTAVRLSDHQFTGVPALSADDQWAAAAGVENISIWPVFPTVLLAIAREVVGRNLTLEEWHEAFPGVQYRRTFSELPWPRFDPRFKEISLSLPPTEVPEKQRPRREPVSLPSAPVLDE